MTDDWIRDRIIAVARDKDLSFRGIAAATDLEESTVRRYLSGRCSLNSRYVSRLCDHLGLTLVSVERKRSPGR